MATFYDLAAANRRKSALLVLLVIGIFAALATAAGVALTGGIEGALPYSLFAFGLGFVLTLGAWFGGDRAVLSAAGAKPLDPSAGAEELQLDNITAELSIAANIPKPKIYVVDDTALNAFATGRDPQHASIAVDISNGGIAGRGRHKTRVVCEVAIRGQLADIDDIRADGAGPNRQFDRFAVYGKLGGLAHLIGHASSRCACSIDRRVIKLGAVPDTVCKPWMLHILVTFRGVCCRS